MNCGTCSGIGTVPSGESPTCADDDRDVMTCEACGGTGEVDDDDPRDPDRKYDEAKERGINMSYDERDE